MADITPHHESMFAHLLDFDWMLAHGPDYPKLGVMGAVAGAVVSLAAGKKSDRGEVGHALKYGAAGAGVALGGVFLLFQAGKLISQRSHEALATGPSALPPAVGYGRGGFGRGGGRGGFGHHGFGHHDHHRDDQGGDDQDQDQGMPHPMRMHHGWGRR
jgi:hypothetical protein